MSRTMIASGYGVFGDTCAWGPRRFPTPTAPAVANRMGLLAWHSRPSCIAALPALPGRSRRDAIDRSFDRSFHWSSSITQFDSFSCLHASLRVTAMAMRIAVWHVDIAMRTIEWRIVDRWDIRGVILTLLCTPVERT